MRIEIHSNGNIKYILPADPIGFKDLPINERIYWFNWILHNRYDDMLKKITKDLPDPKVYIVLPSKINDL